MAWDASDRIRASDPQLRTLNLSKNGLDDEPSFNLSISFSSQEDVNMGLGGLLSPIEEESGFAIDNAPLQVKVTVKFLDPVVKSLHYSRTFSSSADFQPTDRICRGLLQRIDHCSKELITRHDPEALNARLRQAPRFEINFQLRRDGYPGTWAERTFQSYQKQTITNTLAKDITGSTHSIVCVFLRHHDKHFKWTNDPSQDYFHDRPTTFKPSLSGAPDLSCVPRSRFIESTQTWEFVPGYTLELVFKSRNPSRRQAQITRNLKVNSNQTAPLNLGQGETLLWQAYRTLEDMLDSKRTAFEIEHANCDGFEGVPDCDCQHYDEDALEVQLSIVNNLGPYYEHLHRNIQSRIQLFRHVCGNDCDEFVREVQASFDQLRDKVDEKLDSLNDFDFRIAELVGHGWRIKNAARFTLDSKQSHTRRTIEALLDRIRTGVGDVLRGHDVAIRMIAHKRGHLILDKALIARRHRSMPGPFASATPEDEQALFVAHLKARIQADIDLVCKDTCSLEDVPDGPSPEHSERPHNSPSRPFTPRSTFSDWLVLPKVRRDSPEIHQAPTSYTPPGSPGHFTQPPVLPCIPPRSSSMRVFPLVPAKYRGNEDHSRNTTPSEPDSAIAVDFESDRSIPDGTVSVASSVSGKTQPSTNDGHREVSTRGGAPFVLSPAAEVLKGKEAKDDDSSSSRSTCSSMPALTESEMATPEQSLLITPSQMRHASPKSAGLPFFNDFEYGEPSSPLVMSTPDMSGTVQPEEKALVEQEDAVSKFTVISAACPLTPSGGGTGVPAPADALEFAEVPDDADVGSVTACQEDPQQNYEGDAVQELEGIEEPASHEETGSGLCIIDNSDLAGHSFDASECESSEIVRRDSPAEGWLLHCVEDLVDHDDTAQEDTEYSQIIAGVAECGSSDTLRTQILVLDDAIVEQDPPEPQSNIGSNSASENEPQQQLEQDCQEAIAPLSGPKEDANPPVLTKTPETAWSNGSDNPSADMTQVRDLSAEDELSRSKMDFFEADDEDTDSEELGVSRPVGGFLIAESSSQPLEAFKEPQVHAGCVEPSSDSENSIPKGSEAVEGPDSESEHHATKSIGEAGAETFPDLSCSVIQHSRTGNSASLETSGALDSEVVRGGVQNAPRTVSLELNTPKEPPQPTSDLVVSDHLAASTPKTPSHSVFPEEVAAERTPTQCDFASGITKSGPTQHDTSRSFAQTKPTPTHVGLKNNFLLPSLPVFASLDPTVNESRASFQSSSSEWEDCVSEARQSSDSVDTIQRDPSLSDEDAGSEERPGSPKRLGTPTAGILGLHESRWADFGIRGALTGSHAFDRPSTAPIASPNPSRPEEKAELRSEKVDEDGEQTPRPHRKSLHLLHKKSISSIIFPGTHHGHQLHQHSNKPPRLSKKESKELRAREKKEAKARPKGKQNSKPAADVPNGEDAGDAGRFPRAMMLVAGLAIASSVVNRTS
ncbi:hypothetical protein J7T55_007143 [Diaporthe amygdali]|uniref:uncharacterized protein n=1 Tax=Phomopsis amygdali TaxID=1214568 RepID=UPI0022FE48FC|nr:uncharacterized protein J7T55_007143 [Diaporthe amygdali]KAJ0107931.1 hypothetical protein J7T55_007143 [Diaporthe amygdali]